ncbi:class I SAM-dependent methyltransferase [Rossellomorea vietnamensis]|nr:class I SAM-dependent methyltransferase [Rossellomorea vietnamensis]
MGHKDLWDSIWSNQGDLDENVFFKCVVDAIIENSNFRVENLKILEAGAGTGTSSLQLAKLGAHVTLVDYSMVAIEKMKKMYNRNQIEADFICGDIREIDRASDSYDIVFNSGVLEHFSYSKQVNILKEMTRICKTNGLILTMNPNAKCLLYRIWKQTLESQDQWIYGEEYPVVSLDNQFRDAGLHLLREYSIGFDVSVEQFGSLYECTYAANIIQEFYNALPTIDKQLFEGYLLCSVGRKF